jgi:hypothetical protein
LARLISRIWLLSGSIASLPDEENENRDHANHDKHPVLAFETQKGKMLNEKLHRARSLFVQNRRFGGKNILFLYLLMYRAAPAGDAALGQSFGFDVGITVAIEARG